MPRLVSRYGPAPSEVGARIKAERLRLGFSIVGCAEAVGISRQTWLGYEATANPQLSMLMALKEIGFDLRNVAVELFE
jgi:predicted transcriptional regulator